MPFIQHHTTQAKDTTVNLQALETANNLVAEQWYFSTTNNRFYYAALSNQLVGPIEPGGSSVTFADTDTITHTDNGGGNFSFNLRVDPAAGNILTSSAAGLFAQDIGIAAGSQNYLEYNSATREISVKNLLITDVTVDTVSATMAAWITANYTGTEFEEGDLVVLTVPDNKESWIHNGGVLGTIADWTNISANIDDAYIRSLISAGPGITYNAATGEISASISIANNALTFNSGRLFLHENVVQLNNGGGTTTPLKFGQTLRLQSAELMTVSQPDAVDPIKSFDFSWDTTGATAGQVPSWNGTNMVWITPGSGDNIYTANGTLTANRELTLGGFNLTFKDSIAANIIQFSEAGSTIKAVAGDIEVETEGSGLIIKSPNGTRQRITVSNAGVLRTESL